MKLVTLSPNYFEKSLYIIYISHNITYVPNLIIYDGHLQCLFAVHEMFSRFFEVLGEHRIITLNN